MPESIFGTITSKGATGRGWRRGDYYFPHPQPPWSGEKEEIKWNDILEGIVIGSMH